jgi:hypothetical protein
LATLADLREQLAGLAIETGLEVGATVALAHALHLGLFVRTPINWKLWELWELFCCR